MLRDKCLLAVVPFPSRAAGGWRRSNAVVNDVAAGPSCKDVASCDALRRNDHLSAFFCMN
jgi:hypothetical protein